jgi:hypothetical protein
MQDAWLVVLLIVIFVIFFSLNMGFYGKPLGNMITQAGVGSILAGLFFGIVREVIMGKTANTTFTLIIMIVYFLWYMCMKGFAMLIVKQTDPDVAVTKQSLRSTVDTMSETKDDLINKSKKTERPKISSLYGVFISVLMILIVIILILTMYSQRGSGDTGSQLMTYSIMLTVMIGLSVIFSFLSGVRLDYDTKIEILSYTIAYAVIFAVLTSIFVFNNFSIKSAVTSSIIFFVWLSLSQSISNFLTYNQGYVNRT